MSIAEPQIPSLQIVAEQFRTEIFAYIQSKVGDAATADDLTQETFIKVGRALAKGITPEHFRGWLYQIARNTLSREELASELGISLTAAKSRVHRARVKLRKAVEECCRLVTDPYGRVMDWRKRTPGSRIPKSPAT
jgi:DNA-directed RNA polymerase specialized sigma24 family protein